MPYKPFLSHKREDTQELAQLKAQLTLRGAGGWQDADDLSLGDLWKSRFRRAIGQETGGFIWYGTRRSLNSWTICKIEVPTALRRTRRSGAGAYPFVPLFVDLKPGLNAEEIKEAFGERRGSRLLDLNGLVRDDAETPNDFARRAARRYVRDLVRQHGDRPLRISITGGREPTADTDLALDWRSVLDRDGRLTDSAALPTLVETLADIRDAAHSRSSYPKLILDPHLRLPLAALVGWQWNRVRQLKLTVAQRSGDHVDLVEDVPSTGTADLPEPRRIDLEGNGPAVVAVSVGKALGDTVDRYANAQSASQAVHLHVPGDTPSTSWIDADGIRSIAAWTVEQLAVLNARGLEKQLLILGPVRLAVLIGTAANGTGKTFVPFWDGASGYVSGVTIG